MSLLRPSLRLSQTGLGLGSSRAFHTCTPHFARFSDGMSADIQLGSLRFNRVGSVGMLLSLLRRLEDSNMFLEDVSVLHYLLGKKAGRGGIEWGCTRFRHLAWRSTSSMLFAGESLDDDTEREEELSQASTFDSIPPQPYQIRPFHHMLVIKHTS